MVPARDEAAVIGATLDSLHAAARQNDIIMVIADRCTDDTAAIARAAGTVVLERPDSAVPGKAAALTDGLAYAAELDWTAVTIVDADSIVNEAFFDVLDGVLGTERNLAQPRSEHIRGTGLLARASEAAFAMQGIALPRGRQALGIGVRLRGTGMTMTRAVAEATPYATGGASEDLFISLDLLLGGKTAVHVEEARLESLSAPSVKAGATQRIRWEQGRMDAARAYVPRLVRAATPASLEAALLLVTPPFAVAAFLLIVGGVLAAAAGAMVVAAVALIFLGLLVVDLAIALVQARAPLATWLALLAAPFYIVWKTWLQLVAIARSRRASEAWEPTSRE
jgi:cellulose synthase/poly-beta-1,6-N-acetylglucosamine synthase-like glycosyltransferase